MPKVDYNKEPFRLCRWNTNPHGSKDGEYYCSDGENWEDEDYCMKCFLNDWYEVCERCGEQILKTEIKWFFEKDNTKMVYICSECEDGEEECDNNTEKQEWKNKISDIKNWQKLNGMKV